MKTLSEFDFHVLRFKLAKLLQTRHRKIQKIDILDNGNVLVATGFLSRSVLFENLKEIHDDFAQMYPDVVVPSEFKGAQGNTLASSHTHLVID